MHEVGLMREVIDLAVAEAERHGAARVHALSIRVGQLSGVDADALSFAFDVASAGTLAEGATLTIVPVAVVCHCPPCNREFTPDGYVFTCPTCGRRSHDIRAGTELELMQLEVSGDGHD